MPSALYAPTVCQEGDAFTWNTLLSPATDSATPSTEIAESWLRAKMMSKTEKAYEQDGCLFETTIVGRYDEFPGINNVGLVFFEAPLHTWDSHKADQWVLPITSRSS